MLINIYCLSDIDIVSNIDQHLSNPGKNEI